MAPEPLLLLCRPGFENDTASEIADIAASLGIGGYCRAVADTGYVLFQPHEGGAAHRLLEAQRFDGLIFARQWCRVLGELKGLPEQNRVGPIAALAAPLGRISDVWLEYPDTNEGKSLSTFCRKFERPLRQGLAQQGLTISGKPADPRLHLFFLDSRHVFVGASSPANSAPWPLGIPRLRMPHEAPSRSTLKLDEALQLFLSEEERGQRLRPGMRAVDLGSAPGGWTWQLVRRSIAVTAVDNGPMAPALMESGLVEHLRVDGFSYRPTKPVDWLVCDMVEQPHRIAALMADWFLGGHCREAIFNLKLPMKKRYQTVRECLGLIQERLQGTSPPFQLACKQLYHDREEVTAHLRRLGR